MAASPDTTLMCRVMYTVRDGQLDAFNALMEREIAIAAPMEGFRHYSWYQVNGNIFICHEQFNSPADLRAFSDALMPEMEALMSIGSINFIHTIASEEVNEELTDLLALWKSRPFVRYTSVDHGNGTNAAEQLVVRVEGVVNEGAMDTVKATIDECRAVAEANEGMLRVDWAFRGNQFIYLARHTDAQSDLDFLAATTEIMPRMLAVCDITAVECGGTPEALEAVKEPVEQWGARTFTVVGALERN